MFALEGLWPRPDPTCEEHQSRRGSHTSGENQEERKGDCESAAWTAAEIKGNSHH